MSEFILMLTQRDQTVSNALEIYEKVKDSGVKYVGFKDVGASEALLRDLTEAIHENGQQAVLKIVSQSSDTEIESARLGMHLGVDYLFGGRHVDLVSDLLGDSDINYFPFCGETRGHPTQLTGSVDEIVADAERLCMNRRVNGLDLLAYRFSGDVEDLIERVSGAATKPVVVAGSIDCFERISVVERHCAWAFTIGSAIFDGRFQPSSVRAQTLEILRRSISKQVVHRGFEPQTVPMDNAVR